MTVQTLGKVAVPTPGTAVPLSATPLRVWKVRVQGVISETGQVHLMNTTGDVIKTFWPTGAGAGGGRADEYEMDAGEEGNAIDLKQYSLDAQIAGEGALLTYWIR